MCVPALGTAKQLGNSANLRVSKAPLQGFKKDTTLKTEKSILSFKFFDQGIHLQMVVFHCDLSFLGGYSMFKAIID